MGRNIEITTDKLLGFAQKKIFTALLEYQYGKSQDGEKNFFPRRRYGHKK